MYRNPLVEIDWIISERPGRKRNDRFDRFREEVQMPHSVCAPQYSVQELRFEVGPDAPSQRVRPERWTIVHLNVVCTTDVAHADRSAPLLDVDRLFAFEDRAFFTVLSLVTAQRTREGRPMT